MDSHLAEMVEAFPVFPFMKVGRYCSIIDLVLVTVGGVCLVRADPGGTSSLIRYGVAWSLSPGTAVSVSSEEMAVPSWDPDPKRRTTCIIRALQPLLELAG